MPNILSRLFKAGVAALPLLTGSPAIAEQFSKKDLSQKFKTAIVPIDKSLLAEARKYLFADMGTIYNVTPETLAKFTYDVYGKEFMEGRFKDHQEKWQKIVLKDFPERLRPVMIKRLKTDDLFFSETLVKALANMPENDWAFPTLYREKKPVSLSVKDKVSMMIGQMIDRGDIKDSGRIPYGFFNLADTDNLTLETPYKNITPEQLARFKTLTPGEEPPIIAMLPPTPEEQKNDKGEILPLTSSDKEIMEQKKAQWQAGYDMLTGLGAEVVVLGPDAMRGGVRGDNSVEHLVRDEALVFSREKIAFVPWRSINNRMQEHPKALERSMILHEHASGPYIKELKDKGYELVYLDSRAMGGDFLTHPQKKLAFLADVGEKNMDDQLRIMREKTGYDVIAVPKLRNETYYHLDTFMMVLPKGEVMIYPHATTEKFMRDLEKRIGADNIIRLSGEEARLMATNMMAVGRTLVMPGASAALVKELENRDYKAVTPAMFSENSASLYGHQRGYLHCLAQELK